MLHALLLKQRSFAARLMLAVDMNQGRQVRAIRYLMLHQLIKLPAALETLQSDSQLSIALPAEL
jgi:hypothetical protein